METELKPLLVTIGDASRLLSLGRVTIRKLCDDGTLPSAVVGRSRVIPYDALVAYAQSITDTNGTSRRDDPG